MQSKTSFFNGTLFRKNLTRFWPLWVGASLLGSLAPLAMLMQLIRMHFRVEMTSLELTDAYYMVLTSVVPVICLIYAVLCALTVWSYLYNARSVGLMHTLPLSRKGLFITNVLSGLAMLLIPYAVTGLLCVVVTAMMGAVAPAALLTTVLCVLGESLFYFASATLVACVTGHAAAMPVLYFIFHFLAAGLEMLLNELSGGFYFGVSGGSSLSVSEWLSPTLALMRKVTYYTEYQRVPVPGRDWYRSELSAVYLENAWIVALYAAIGAGMLVLAWLLYRRRRSESAGDVVAVGWMKPVFRYGCALCAALAGGMLLYTIFWSDFQVGSQYDTVPMAVCMMIAGLLGYYIASMLLAKSLRIFRSTWKGAAGTAAAAALLCGLVAADVLGVEDRVPDAGDIASVYVNIDGGTRGRVWDEDAIERVLEAHRAVLAEKTEFLANVGRAYEEPGWGKAAFWVEYQLKNGSSLNRSYYVDYFYGDADQPDRAIGRLAALATDQAIQRTNLLRDNIDRFTGGEIQCWQPSAKESVYVSIDAEQAQALYEAIGRDIEAGNFGRTAFRENGYYQETYHGDLYLYYQSKPVQEGGASDNASYGESISVSLSVYCTETVKALKDLGLVDEDHLLLTNEEMDRKYEEEDYGVSAAYGVQEDFWPESEGGVIYEHNVPMSSSTTLYNVG